MRARLELSAAPAVPPAVESRPGRVGERRHRAAGGDRGECRAVSAAGLLLVLAFGMGLYARHWLSLAERSRVGARSEDELRRTLAPLEPDGWQLRHSLVCVRPRGA